MRRGEAMQCNLCGSDDTEKFLTLENYPIASGPVRPAGHKDAPEEDIELSFCSMCGHCFMSKPKWDAVAYDDDYVSSIAAMSAGAKMDQKMSEFLDFVGKQHMKKSSKVLEIGCYDGSLMAQMKKRFGFDIIGCDPCEKMASIAEKQGFAVVKEAFPSDLLLGTRFDAVVMRNVFEHVESPGAFLSEVKAVLKPTGLVFIDVPYGRVRINEAVMGSVMPEHPSHFSDNVMHDMASILGMHIKDAQTYPGSVRYCLAMGCNSDVRIVGPGIRDHMKREYFEGAAKLKAKHNDIYEALKGKKNVVFFGANTCTLEILSQCLCDLSEVKFCVDDDPLKWGQELVNYHIPVVQREALAALEGDKTVVLCSYYSHDKLFDQMVETLVPPYKIVRLYPTVKVIEM
jgi:SAM-dependent methyltransferase